MLGDTVGTHQSERLLAFEPVPLDGLTDGFLLFVLEGAQSMGECHTDSAGVHTFRHCVREPLSQRQALLHPIPLLAASPSNGCWAQAIIVPERIDHSRFVHRGERARWTVRQQQGHLLIDA